MRVWQVVLLVDLALAVGVGWGWVRWGLPAQRAQEELAAVRAGTAVEREWKVRGVVRAILPDIGVVVFTHEEIPGLMAPMTMGFRTAAPEIHRAVSVGDAVRFTLRGVPPDVVVTSIEKVAP